MSADPTLPENSGSPAQASIAEPTQGTGSLLPSPFPREYRDDDAHVEGYEGERLQQLFLARNANQGILLRSDGLPNDPGDDTFDNEPPLAPIGPPDGFRPFFTVISDADKGDFHHPYVHYVFSDDDQEPVTQALLETLSSTNRGKAVSADPPQSQQTDRPTTTTTTTTTRTSLTHADGKQRYIILDMDESGQVVRKAKSLSPEWQITDVTILPVPTFNEGEVRMPGAAGSMLQIMGKERQRGTEILDPPEQIMQRARENADGDVLQGMRDLALQLEANVGALKAMSEQLDDLDEEYEQNPP